LTSIAIFAAGAAGVAALAGTLWAGKSRAGGTTAGAERPKWAAFRMADLRERRAQSGDPWLEFFKTSTLRTGLYVLPAGGRDEQTPHVQDEVYHVLTGRATLRVGGEELPVEPGSVVYVRSGIEHRFHDIQEELEVMVFFAG
jgi:mannose-6-phosphate isomerase-like protein (cupin superfamily)